MSSVIRRRHSRSGAPGRIAFALVLALTSSAFAADPPCVPRFVHEPNPSIPVFDALGPVGHPWLGGWEKARPQLADVEGDGDLDLFICEEDGKLRFYRNDGGPLAPDFQFQTDDYGGVHTRFFARVTDLDDDGDLDLLVEAPPVLVTIDGFPSMRPGAFLYWNEGTALSPIFVNRSTHPGKYWVDTTGTPITFFNATPDFVDLDEDGDSDLLMGDGGQGGYIILYRNVGTPTAPLFSLETRQYNDITIVAGGCNPALAPHDPTLRHGFMLFEFHDIDADGHEDLFVGDQFNSNAYYLSNHNAGGSVSPDFTCETEEYFPGADGLPGIFSQYILTAFGDLDGDGDADAIAGSGVSSDLALLSFENVGTPQVASFELRSEDAMPELDLGRASAPTLVDLDGDSVLDLAVGIGNGQRVTTFHNSGSDVAPSFFLETPILVSVPQASWAAPEFADIDHDLDLDLFVGTSSGAVRYWRNDGGPGAPPAYVEILTDPAFGAGSGKLIRDTVDEWSVPRFFDDDGDGDLDLLLGNWSFSNRARLILFRNDGNRDAHSFVLASLDFQDLGELGQNLAPDFGDYDGDGDLDLVVGNFEGRVLCFRNVEYTGMPRFMRQTNTLGGIDVGESAIPTLGDLDGDGDLDLVVGESGGGLNFYRNESEPGRFEGHLCDPIDGWDYRPPGPPISETPPPADPSSAGGPGVIGRFALTNVFPTPTRGTTSVEFFLPRDGRVEASITDANGRRVARIAEGARHAGAHTIRWDGRADGGLRAAPGVYHARVTFEGRTLSRSFIVLR